MSEIDKKELDIFAENMIKAYKNTSILKGISRFLDYSEEHKTKDFIQIGHRTLIPKKFFEVGNNVDNTILAGGFARSIVWGEENFIIDHLKNLAKENKIAFHKISEFSYEEITKIIFGLFPNDVPTDIFIPIDEPYYNEVHNWLYKGKAEYKDGLHILLGHQKIKVHWSTKYTPFNDIIFMNKNAIRIIQKKFVDMKLIEKLENPFYASDKKEPLGIEFRKSDKIDQLDMYIRSVILVEIIDRNSVGVIQLPKIKKSE